MHPKLAQLIDLNSQICSNLHQFFNWRFPDKADEGGRPIPGAMRRRFELASPPQTVSWPLSANGCGIVRPLLPQTPANPLHHVDLTLLVRP
jgi:hypothetical protein